MVRKCIGSRFKMGLFIIGFSTSEYILDKGHSKALLLV